ASRLLSSSSETGETPVCRTTETAVLLLRQRQQFLPIEHELPGAIRVGLPDVDEMSGLSRLRPRIGATAVAVGEIAAAAHIGLDDFYYDAGLLRTEQFYPVLFPHGLKRAVAIT